LQDSIINIFVAYNSKIISYPLDFYEDPQASPIRPCVYIISLILLPLLGKFSKFEIADKAIIKQTALQLNDRIKVCMSYLIIAKKVLFCLTFQIVILTDPVSIRDKNLYGALPAKGFAWINPANMFWPDSTG
jgi:uncharacterized membrane protein